MPLDIVSEHVTSHDLPLDTVSGQNLAIGSTLILFSEHVNGHGAPLDSVSKYVAGHWSHLDTDSMQPVTDYP